MEALREKVKKVIAEEVFIPREKEENSRDSAWIFDFRRVLLRADFLDDIGELFFEMCQDNYPFQIGGMEVAGIPLMTALVLKLKQKGKEVNGFFIRKSRKREGLMRMIEGRVDDGKILLVDDTMNSGKSFIRQVEVIESLGKKVQAVFVILRYRDLSYYTYFHERGIRIYSLFELNDFQEALSLKNTVDDAPEPVPMPFRPQWFWRTEKPKLFQVRPKSAPVLDDTRLYFGTDEGNFWALNQSDGSVAWKFPTLFGAKWKKTFSSPVLDKSTVYFGANDGNLYALDTETGAKRWAYREADWIESTPCLASELGFLVCGFEFGIWNKQGGVVALDAETGKKHWGYSVPEAVSSSPSYSKRHNLLVFSHGPTVTALHAKTGAHVWDFDAKGEVHDSFSFDEVGDRCLFGSTDSHLYILETVSGKLLRAIQTDEPIWSTPFVHERNVYIASLDKNLYCIDMDSGEIIWKFATRGRIFASPKLIDESLYIGSNDGRLYELNCRTGENTALFQSIERIVDKIAYNEKTGRIFLPTFANELYCLERHPKQIV